jgi:hypothetical protein
LFDAVELPELLPPQAASARAAAAATVVVRLRRPRVLLSVLANVPLLRYAAIAGVRYRGSVLARAQSAARSGAHLCVSCSTDHRTGIVPIRSRSGQELAQHSYLGRKRSYVHN